MIQATILVCGILLNPGNILQPGQTFERSVQHENRKRTFLVHVPKGYVSERPTPVVLALHGATMDASVMAYLTGLEAAADKHGFIVVFPNGTGPVDILLTWNAGAFPGGLSKSKVDDVGFVAKVLDDVEAVLNVDRKRVYATGLSNGAMMCYRLASELSDRIAAIAPVSGTLALDAIQPQRPVSVLHFHGTSDPLVPMEGSSKNGANKLFMFKSVEESIGTWVRANHCPVQGETLRVPTRDNRVKVTVRRYGPGEERAEVVLYTVEGGGHTWPGRDLAPVFLGRCVRDLSANEIMWDFFERHPMQ